MPSDKCKKHIDDEAEILADNDFDNEDDFGGHDHLDITPVSLFFGLAFQHDECQFSF